MKLIKNYIDYKIINESLTKEYINEICLELTEDFNIHLIYDPHKELPYISSIDAILTSSTKEYIHSNIEVIEKIKFFHKNKEDFSEINTTLEKIKKRIESLDYKVDYEHTELSTRLFSTILIYKNKLNENTETIGEWVEDRVK